MLLGLGFLSNTMMLSILRMKFRNNRGEAGEKTEAKQESSKTFTQEQLNDIVAAERKRTLEKFSDYDDLRKKVSEFDKQQEELKNKDLESRKEYEKLKEGWSNKEKEYQNLLNQEKVNARNLRVSYELNQEVMRQNAHGDAVKLISDLTTVDDQGNVKIKGKDANGMETLLSVQDGLKQFLKERPYLVKATGQGGAGTSAASSGGSSASGNQSNLADDLVRAKQSGDLQKVREIKNSIRQKYNNFGMAKI